MHLKTRTFNANPISEVTIEDDNGSRVSRYFSLRVGRFIRFHFHDGGKIELVVGRFMTSPAFTLRRGRKVWVQSLALVVFMLLPSLATAQAFPSAELLKTLPAPVYEAAQKAEAAAKDLEALHAKNIYKLKLAEDNLRQAIANESNSAKFEWLVSEYVLADMEVATVDSKVVGVANKVMEVYFGYIHDRAVADKFFQWLQSSNAYAGTFFVPDMSDRQPLSKAVIDKRRKLSGK